MIKSKKGNVHFHYVQEQNKQRLNWILFYRNYQLNDKQTEKINLNDHLPQANYLALMAYHTHPTPVDFIHDLVKDSRQAVLDTIAYWISPRVLMDQTVLPYQDTEEYLKLYSISGNHVRFHGF